MSFFNVTTITRLTSYSNVLYPTALPNSTSLGQGIFGQTNNLQLKQQQQQQQLSLLQDEKLKFHMAIKSPSVFGDEKDQILMKFNMLQACCGTGRGLVNYYGQLQAVNFTMENPLCRFKVCVWCVYAVCEKGRSFRVRRGGVLG